MSLPIHCLKEICRIIAGVLLQFACKLQNKSVMNDKSRRDRYEHVLPPLSYPDNEWNMVR
jgi:hypothetical protein